MNPNTVLIFSDKPEAAATWADAFHQRGLQPARIDSLDALLRAWFTVAPLLTIVDLTVPAAISLEICRRLRQAGPHPILLLLELPGTEEILDAYRLGVDECLLQPVNPAVVMLKALAWSMRSGSLPLEADAVEPFLPEGVAV